MRLPSSWKNARVTLAIAVVTAAAWLVAAALGRSQWAADVGGFVPAALAADLGIQRVPAWLTPLTATLVHASLLHLGLNLLIHLFCGRPVESVLGPWALAILYLGGAYAAAGAHYLAQPLDATPMIGASGAISAILGAYAILFGRNKVKVASTTLALWLHALWLMVAWVALQLIVGITFAGQGINVAIAAHIGGFVFGVLLANPLLLLRYRKA
jgi:membrane associated rhomboid family serine protease